MVGTHISVYPYYNSFARSFEIRGQDMATAVEVFPKINVFVPTKNIAIVLYMCTVGQKGINRSSKELYRLSPYLAEFEFLKLESCLNSTYSLFWLLP